MKNFGCPDLFWAILLLLVIGGQNALGQSPPSGFASATVSSQWNEAVGIAFNEDGTEMFVWERGGKVYVEKDNQKKLLLDISEEVGGWHDHGLLGFALHPQFSQNGFFYLLYLVDRHYLMHYGTGAYNATTNDYFSATIGRLTRYTASKNASGYTVDPQSRKILIGATKSTGILSIARSHVTGSLVFGTDKTLLVSTGDGGHGAVIDTGSAAPSYYQQALQDGILTPALNVGAYRAQVVNSLNGKILRIDPETGAGIPSNPFYDAANPNAPISKVWALGIRQPFRMSLKPGSGSHNPGDANPGILYVGDIGYQSWEELNVVDKPGMNFGWPIYEGLELSGIYSTINIGNPFAPNPLYQVNGCNRQYFYFQDLLKPATPSGSAIFTNPCNTQQTIPTSIPTFVHSRPIIDWAHGPSGPSRAGTFNGQTPTVTNIGPGAPVTGSQFGGDCGVAGVFYTGTDFPEEYRNTFFFGDYGRGWIKNLKVNATDNPVQVGSFINSNAVVVGMATHPAKEGLYYVNFPSEIRRIYYSSNRPPVAVASSDKNYGVSPLLVQFTGSNSVDPENQPLFYEWNFGDGSPLSNQANPSHTFTAAGTNPVTYTVTLKVRDSQGAEDQKTLVISNNNSPPQVQITSPIDNTLYPLSGETVYPLRATVTDQEHSGQQLSYQWQTILHHQTHQHPEPFDLGIETTTNISPIGCDGETYFYRIVLTVTDASGASTTKEVKLFPNCGNEKITPLITWANPAAIVAGTALSTAQLNATAMHNGTPVAGAFTYTPPLGTVLSTGQTQLSVTFLPNDPSSFNSASKSVAIEVKAIVPSLAWPTPLPITAGTALGSTQLNASATYNGVPVAGVFTYTPPAGTVLGAGNNQNLTVSFAPSDPSRYSSSSKTVSIDVKAIMPLLTWTTPLQIPSGTALSPTQLNATATHNGSPVAGTYTYAPPLGTVLRAGDNQELTVNFAPADVLRYSSAVKKVFINVKAISPLITWPTPQPIAEGIALSSAQLNAIASYNSTPIEGTFTYTPPSGTVLGIGAGQQLSVSFAPTDNTQYSSAVKTVTIDVIETAPPRGTFYRAINLNGPALSIDANNWEASASAPNFTFTTNATVFSYQHIQLIPPTDPNRATMIRSSIWGNVNLTVSAVPAGTYLVWVYVWEDNNPEIFSVLLEGKIVGPNHNSGKAGNWGKLGPFEVAISDGAINVSSTGGAANFSGLEIWSAVEPVVNQPPIVSNAIVDQNTVVGAPFTFTVPANTFTDPNIETILTYTAELSNGIALPTWLNFDGSNRLFSGTPMSGDIDTLHIRVTASDGAGGLVSDVFVLHVSPSEPNVHPPKNLYLTAYPNPFATRVRIKFTAKETTVTQLKMYDMRGAKVRILFEGILLAGDNEILDVETDAMEMADGVYILELVNGQHLAHFKLALAR